MSRRLLRTLKVHLASKKGNVLEHALLAREAPNSVFHHDKSKNRDTSSAVVHVVCARVFAGRRYGLLLRKKRC